MLSAAAPAFDFGLAPRYFTFHALSRPFWRRSLAIGESPSEVYVFYPFCQFFYSTTTYVSADIRFSTQHFAEVEELMCTETVVFNCTSPVIVYHFGAVLFRTDTVHPVIFIGKTATRPTKYGNLEFFQCIEYVGTITFDIGNIRIFSYPKSTINTGAQMFGKLAVNFFGNNLCALVGMKRDRCTLLCGQRYGCS